MTLDDAARQLAHVLRAENQMLATGDADAAALMLPQKQAALGALQAALPGAAGNPALAEELRSLAAENRALLAQAIEVQGRILELVARAARRAAPGPVHYGARGTARHNTGAIALTLRA